MKTFKLSRDPKFLEKLTDGWVHAEGSLEADLWVLDRALRILLGEVGQVVKGIRQTITKRGLCGPKRKTMEAVALLSPESSAYAV